MEATQRSRRLRALAAGLGTSRRSARSCCCDRIAAVDGAAAAGAAARPPATAGAADSDAREQLLDLGYCVVPDVLSPDLLRRLRAVTDEFLDAQPREDSLRHRSQGSMIPVPGRDAEAPVDPVFLQLLTWQPALDALVALGFPRGGATFTDGYVISKPPRSPPLFWHYDWFSWELSEDWAPRGAQYFLMYYLHSTTPDNGCLRAIPGSHFRHNELRDSLLAPHNPEYSSAEDLSSPGFAQRPDEVDVPVDAADLLIGDARMLHATHPNRSDRRRTVITLWYQPDFDGLPLKHKAQMLAKTMTVPSTWAEEEEAAAEEAQMQQGQLHEKLVSMMPPARWARAGLPELDVAVEQHSLDLSRQLYRQTPF